jgi:hypothetical protein
MSQFTSRIHAPWGFALGFVVLIVLPACSNGTRGLVLGRPTEVRSGDAGAQGTLGGGGGSDNGSSGDRGGSGSGGSALPSVAGGISGSGPDMGMAGAPPSENDPPWVAEKCKPIINFVDDDPTNQDQVFKDAVPDPPVPIWAATRAACRMLFRDGSEVKSVPEVTLILEDSPDAAGATGTELHLSTRYLKMQADSGVDMRFEITGVLHFLIALVYENDGADADGAPPRWLLVGIADYVRLESGYIDRSARAKGGAYDDDSKTTAFFIEYLARSNPDIVYRLNQRLSPGSAPWTDDVFIELMGSDLGTLWADYQGTL